MSIVNRKEHYLQQIEYYQKKLDELQEECTHKNTKQETCSWRPGSTFEGRVCKDCGKILKNLDLSIKYCYSK